MFAARLAAFLLALAAVLPAAATAAPESRGSHPGFASTFAAAADDDLKDLETTLKFLEYDMLVTRRDGKWEVLIFAADAKKLNKAIPQMAKLDADIHITDAGSITDDHLAELAKIDRLKALALTLNNKVTDDGIANLKDANGLTELRLEICLKLTPDAIGHVGDMPRLTRLTLSSFQFPDDDALAPLARLKKLVALKLDGCSLADRHLDPVARMASLRDLSLIRNDKLTAAGLNKLTTLAKLDSLDVTAIPLADADLAVVAKWPALTRLVLRDTKVTDAGLARVARAKKLIHLDLANCRITGDGFEPLAGLADLETLNLSGTSVSGVGFEHLGGLANLQTLGLRRLPKLTGDGLEHLADCENLTVLDLSLTGVGDAGLAKVGKLKQLRVLALPNYAPRTRPDPDQPALARPFPMTDDGRVSDAGLRHVATLTNLREVSLGGKALTDDGLGRLAVLKGLRKLTLGPVPGITGTALAKFVTVVELNLSNSGLSDEALANIAELTKVKKLWLPKTATDEAAVHLKGLRGVDTVYFWKGVTPKGQMALRKTIGGPVVLLPGISD